jgi:hypothetical protein
MHSQLHGTSALNTSLPATLLNLPVLLRPGSLISRRASTVLALTADLFAISVVLGNGDDGIAVTVRYLCSSFPRGLGIRSVSDDHSKRTFLDGRVGLGGGGGGA